MKKTYKILIGIAIVLIIIRIILPYVILHFANKNLANMKGYYGHIEDIDLSIYRGAYGIDDIYINKVDTLTKKETDFFKADYIDLSIEWKSLFKGAIVGELEFESPVIIFTRDKVELGDVQKDTADFRELLKDFMPLRVNRFEITNGAIHYVDKSTTPNVDVYMTETYVLATNLSNVTDKNQELPSTVMAKSNLYEGTLDFNMRVNVLSEELAFDLNAELKNTNLVLLNDFFKAYGNFDVNKGVFGLYVEMATKKHRFKGYVKPLIQDLDVLGPEDRSDAFLHKIWEGTVGTAGAVFKNQRKDQVGTKVPLEGDLSNPEASILDAVWEVLRNAFIQALMPTIDHEINIRSVEKPKEEEKPGLLKRIFSKDEDKKKEDKDGKDKKK